MGPLGLPGLPGASAGPPPPPPPPPAPTAPAKTVVRGAGDAMKMALQRKASKKLVERKPEVQGLVKRVSELSFASVVEAVVALHELEGVADELGLPLAGDDWGERLTIKKKGGGVHFQDDERALAAAAFARAGVLHSLVTWHEQLVNRSTQITSAVGAFRTKGGAGASMSKGKMLDRCGEILTLVGKTIHDIFSDGAFAATLKEAATLGVPQNLQEDADALRKQALLLAEFAHELALAELAGLRSEKKLTQKFRAPQTLAVLTSADSLMRNVDAAARPAAHVPSEQISEISEAIAEVQPMVGSGAAADDDELDDDI